MSFTLPAEGTEARLLMGDIGDIATALNPVNYERLPLVTEAVENAKKIMAETDAIVSISVVVRLLKNRERWLILIEQGGTWRKLWSFGDNGESEDV